MANTSRLARQLDANETAQIINTRRAGGFHLEAIS